MIVGGLSRNPEAVTSYYLWLWKISLEELILTSSFINHNSITNFYEYVY